MSTELELLTEILTKVSGMETAFNEVLLPKPTGIPATGDSSIIAPISMNWTLSKTDLIELIYALHSGGAFNRGTATIAQITRFFESVLSIQLGNTSMVFQEILRRKDSTAFLHRLIDKLEEHITNIDEKRFN